MAMMTPYGVIGWERVTAICSTAWSIGFTFPSTAADALSNFNDVSTVVDDGNLDNMVFGPEEPDDGGAPHTVSQLSLALLLVCFLAVGLGIRSACLTIYTL